MKLKSIIQTCSACPSQWEIKLTDGRMIYVRYRWGVLSMNISPTFTKDIYDAVGGEKIYRKSIGDGFDGTLTQEELLPHLKKAGITNE